MKNLYAKLSENYPRNWEQEAAFSDRISLRKFNNREYERRLRLLEDGDFLEAQIRSRREDPHAGS